MRDSRFRSYALADRKACLDVLESNTPPFFLPTDRLLFEAFLQQLPGPYFVLTEHDRVAACGGCASDADGAAALTWGMVRRDLHCRGLGRELLRYRLDVIGGTGAPTLVRVRTSQLVQGFFETEGFTLRSVVPNGFGPGLDKVTMEVQL